MDGELLPSAEVTCQSELEEYVRANACHFNGSLCGSCRMSADEADRLAVVDTSLRVRGVAGVRVCDASILPSLVGGQLNATVTAVAEKAACMLAADATASGTARQLAPIANAAAAREML